MSQQQSTKIKSQDIIFHEGDPGDCAYMIESGRALVYLEKDGQEIPLEILTKGDLFGEMALIDESPRSASCRAIEDLQLLIITKNQLLSRVDEADPVVRLMINALLDRIRTNNQRIQKGPTLSKGDVTKNTGKLVRKKEQVLAALEVIELENRITVALEKDEFTPFYQPIYDFQNKQLSGCEALIRWISHNQGIIPPALFMDAMEDTSLILIAGRRILEKSMLHLRQMLKTFGNRPDFFVSINISGKQFMDPDFIPHLEESRKKVNASASHIKLELTERILTRGDEAVKAMSECRALGYHIAIDDFGTDFSSLQYLARMPITHLKIDRSFVTNLFTDQKSLLIVKSLIHMSGLMELKLIAEGVETKEQLDLLKQLGVPCGQGFLFSKPLPLDEFLKLSSFVQI